MSQWAKHATSTSGFVAVLTVLVTISLTFITEEWMNLVSAAVSMDPKVVSQTAKALSVDLRVNKTDAESNMNDILNGLLEDEDVKYIQKTKGGEIKKLETTDTVEEDQANITTEAATVSDVKISADADAGIETTATVDEEKFDTAKVAVVSDVKVTFDAEMNDILDGVPEVRRFSVDDDLSSRSTRFPSFNERVRYYMSDWYAPRCSEDQKILFSYIAKDPKTSPKLVLSYRETGKLRQSLMNNSFSDPDVILFHAEVMSDQLFYLVQRSSDQQIPLKTNNKGMKKYANDAQATIWKNLQQMDEFQFDHLNSTDVKTTVPSTPFILRFGDSSGVRERCADFPRIQKIRSADSAKTRWKLSSKECHTRAPTLDTTTGTVLTNPIIWNLNRNRHFGMLGSVDENDTRWKRKKSTGIWRGVWTGIDSAKKDRGKKKCLRSARCRLVYNYYDSKLVSARMTSTLGQPSKIDGKNLKGDKKSLRQMLEYKAIIILEGNDVASGLKWALLSNSVVLMQTPRFTSWAMEEFLEPWVHYIPLNEELTDVEEKIQWMRDNDEKAQTIAKRATLWMKDLSTSAEAKEEDKQIQKEILRRYSAHFRAELTDSW